MVKRRRMGKKDTDEDEKMSIGILFLVHPGQYGQQHSAPDTKTTKTHAADAKTGRAVQSSLCFVSVRFSVIDESFCKNEVPCYRPPAGGDNKISVIAWCVPR